MVIFDVSYQPQNNLVKNQLINNTMPDISILHDLLRKLCHGEQENGGRLKC
ncbi:hypothetical protein GAGA_0123 [Paraglaciecola agarilytica NO2]|uniref:Uncharacterized protein n=1 Tax=Paraglaciecola agarilytica NO2 TaxID=1125747 RepID=A0ABQ0I0Z5_9ALTE|nr:hypothetical protein GAGA_0123 [Paraglaciecola agarilytica NO2]